MDARLQQICAMVQTKPRSIDELALGLKMPVNMVGMLVGKLRSAGALRRDDDNVSAADVEQVRAIAAAEVELPKRKKKKPKKANGHAEPPPEAIPAGDDATHCFGKDEDGFLTIARRDGEGTTQSVPPDELARLYAYLRANFAVALKG